MLSLYIFRHGETDWNAEGRFQGHIDVPLNEKGRAQARLLGLRVAPLALEAILSSDLSRARETAEIVAAASARLAIHVDPRLREAYLGEAQGLRAQEIETRFPEISRRWKTALPSDADIAYPGGETAAEIIARALAAIHDFALSTGFSRIGVSCHGGVVRRLMQATGGSLEPVPIPNGVLYHLRYDPALRALSKGHIGELE